MNMRHLTLKISFIFLLLFAFSALPSLQAQDLPDLVITDIQFSPEQPNPQEIVTVTATVQNIGSSVANAFRVTFNANITLTKEVPSLAPDASAIVRFSWFGPEGEHTIRIEANPFDDVEESNKENNFLEKNILVARDPLPDFVVERVTITPENPLPREEATVEITVKNIGTLASSRALMEVRDDQGVLGRPRINALEPDQTETVSLTWRPLEGERRLTIKVDDINGQGRIEELDEKNNIFTQVVTISNIRPTGANLVIRSLSILPENETIDEHEMNEIDFFTEDDDPTTLNQVDPFDFISLEQLNPFNENDGKLMLNSNVKLTALIANIGEGKAAEFSLKFEADGLPIESVDVAPLAAGEEREVSVNWTATAVGERLIRVKADELGTIIEPDETDNISTQFVQIGEQINACGQVVWLKLEDEAAEILSSALSLSVEEVFNVFMPLLKLVMEADFDTVNIRFTLEDPPGVNGRIDFISREPPDTRLGDAPLDLGNRNPADVGRVYVSRFNQSLANAQLVGTRSLGEIAQAMAKVASHEVGHTLGLDHDATVTTDTIMSPSFDNQAGSASLFTDASFTEENFEYLRSILPLMCNR